MLTYNGYTASIKVDVEADILYGRVLDINDVVTFEGKTVEEAKQEFQKSVDTYLKFCRDLGQEPNKPFSGKLPFRTTSERHRAIYLAATKREMSINSWMDETLAKEAEQVVNHQPNRASATPSDAHAYRQRLTQMEDRINELLKAVRRFLINDKPKTVAQFLAEIWKFMENKDLQDAELKQLTDKTQLPDVVKDLSRLWLEDVPEPQILPSSDRKVAHRPSKD